MLKYDNCKNCVSGCEHAGKDREFVCPGGISCKVVCRHGRVINAAADFAEAIKKLAENPQNLENLQSYLAQHFPEWLERCANTPGRAFIRPLRIFVWPRGKKCVHNTQEHVILWAEFWRPCPLKTKKEEETI